MYSLPQEIEVWYILPAIRKGLAKQLTQVHKISYENAGNMLGISKAAISQYLSNKRANKIKLSADVLKEVKKSALILSKEPKRGLIEIQRIMKFMKDTKFSCEVCKKYNKEVLSYCNGHTAH